jgi:hypothetical protein
VEARGLSCCLFVLGVNELGRTLHRDNIITSICHYASVNYVAMMSVRLGNLHELTYEILGIRPLLIDKIEQYPDPERRDPIAP